MIDIAFPCYNAELWINRFIQSLLETGDEEWRIVARDDGSSDGTLELLRSWRERLGSRMVLLEEEGPSRNLGVIGNYNAVLSACSAPWILTADPDDLWLPNRLPLTLGALKAAELEHGEQTPIAVGTDAEVVDSDENPVAPSYLRWGHGMPPPDNTAARVALDNVALGSTMAVNRALLRAALPMPAAAIYQDWWLALVAISLGRLVILPEATIRYRRHIANTSKEPCSTSTIAALWQAMNAPFSLRRRLLAVICKVAPQAGSFADLYADRLSPTDLAALRALSKLPDYGPIKRRIAVVQHGLWFNTALWNLGMLVLL